MLVLTMQLVDDVLAAIRQRRFDIVGLPSSRETLDEIAVVHG